MTDIYGASKNDWDHFSFILNLIEDLLPVVSNPNVKISPHSAIKTIGQIPSLINAQGFASGFSKWTEYKSTDTDITTWSKNPDHGICLQTRLIRALDCDITEPKLASEVFHFIADFLDITLPTRGRNNASKFLKIFKLPGQYGKRVIKLNAGNKGDKIEFLGTGQQFIAIGTHPSSVHYEWAGGLPLEIPELTPEQFEQLWSALSTKFGEENTQIKDYHIRNQSDQRPSDDPVLDFLETHDHTLGTSQEGAAYISCPFKANHTKQGDKTETIYFPTSLRGYDQGHFHCLHASCEDKTDDDFLNAFSYYTSAFDDLGPLPESEQPKSKFQVINAHDYSHRPPIDWIVKGVIPKGSLMAIFGCSGDGKTFVALDLLLAIARGAEWQGRRVVKGRVIYVCAEGRGGFVSRLNAYAKHNQITLERLPLGIIPETPNFRTNQDVRAISQAINAYGPTDVIVIDTLAQVTPGADENAGKDMGVALRHCEELHYLTGAMVCLIGHAGKDQTKGMRGWSGMKAPLDAELEVSREGEERRLWITKMKDGRDGFGWNFNLLNVPVGLDKDGDLIESCVCQFTGDASSQRIRERPVLGKNEQVVFDAYEKLGGGRVSLTELINSSARNLLGPVLPGERDRRKELIRQAISRLTKNGSYRLEDGFFFEDLSGQE